MFCAWPICAGQNGTEFIHIIETTSGARHADDMPAPIFRVAGMRNRLVNLALVVVILIALLPAAALYFASWFAAKHGCSVSAGFSQTCVVDGRDWTPTLVQRLRRRTIDVDRSARGDPCAFLSFTADRESPAGGLTRYGATASVSLPRAPVIFPTNSAPGSISSPSKVSAGDS